MSSKAPPQTKLNHPPAGQAIEVAISSIELDHRNDRLKETHDADAIERLARSMASVGILEPLGVAPGSKPDRYRLVYGHRRLAAAKKAGLGSVPAILRAYADDEEIQIARAVENVHRQDLNPVEEAIAAAALIEAEEARMLRDDVTTPNTPPDLSKVRSMAIKLVAGRLGKSEAWVRDRSYLATLGPKERALVLDGRLPLGWARELCKVADPAERARMAQQYAAPAGDNRLPRDFSDLKDAVGAQLRSLASVPWRLDVAFASAPACRDCPHNSANNPGLFEHVGPVNGSGWNGTTYKEPEAGVCLKAACFQEKSATSNRQIAAKGKSIAREISALPKADRPAVTAVALTTSAKLKTRPPEYLQPSKVAARVKEELERKPEKKSSCSTGSTSSATRTKARTPTEIATGKYEDALRAWAGKSQNALTKAIRANPLCLAIYEALASLDGWYNDKNNPMSRADVLASITAMKAPDLAAVKTAWGIAADDDQGGRYGEDELRAAVAKTLGVGGKPPELADFLADAKVDAAKAKATESTPSGKKTASKKDAAIAGDDGEPDHFEAGDADDID